jgi:hypothetical protein
MRQFTKIVNAGGRYTNPSKARAYVGRGLAELISGTIENPIEIRMLDEAELSFVRSLMRKAAADPVTGEFSWHVGDSGGSQLMKMLTGRGTKPGVSGGYRVFQAKRGTAASFTQPAYGASKRKPSLDELDR